MQQLQRGFAPPCHHHQGLATGTKWGSNQIPYTCLKGPVSQKRTHKHKILSLKTGGGGLKVMYVHGVM